MAVELSTALAGLATAQERLRASANNLAQASSKLQRPLDGETGSLNQGAQTELRLTRDDPDLARSLVEQRSAAYQFVANLRVLQTQLRLSGVMLDIYV
jgi:flagellar hook protein FlgE